MRGVGLESARSVAISRMVSRIIGSGLHVDRAAVVCACDAQVCAAAIPYTLQPGVLRVT